MNFDDRKHAFMRATHSFANAEQRWKDRAATGQTDEQLAEALRYELGIFGGSGAKGKISIAYQGAGLKIWASWSSLNHCTDAPIFEGAATIAMARQVFAIPDPTDRQMSLF